MTYLQTAGFDRVFICIVQHANGDWMTREGRVRECRKMLDSMTGYTPGERVNAIKAAQSDGYLTFEEAERLGVLEPTAPTMEDHGLTASDMIGGGN